MRQTYGEGTRRVAGCSPTPAPVKSKALIGNDLEDTAATERLGVRLPLDLENVERKQHNLADADQAILHVRNFSRQHG